MLIIQNADTCLYRNKLYKRKFKEWRWSKYLPAEKADWMLRKAEKRKGESQKETLFHVGGRNLSVENIQRKVKRPKIQDVEILDGKSFDDGT